MGNFRGNFEIEPANNWVLGFRFTGLPAQLQTHGARFKCYSTPRTVAETQTLRRAASGPSLQWIVLKSSPTRASVKYCGNARLNKFSRDRPPFFSPFSFFTVTRSKQWRGSSINTTSVSPFHPLRRYYGDRAEIYFSPFPLSLLMTRIRKR